tara:strand:+ start:332746 stop:333525 length:780 start_codon:yes stop_codon:yes gene_type:complete
MILRRLATSIRKQDWFAVIIETSIVVFGVYLGVQLGNWNSTRQQRVEYEQSLDRALMEVRGNLEAIEYQIEVVEERLPAIQAAIEVLRTCREDDEARAILEASFAPLRTLNAFSTKTQALDQLISNDRFLTFQSAEVREILLSLSTGLNILSERSRELNANNSGLEFAIGHVVRPGELGNSGPQDVLETVLSGEIATPELVRSWELIVPMSEACRDEDFLQLFFTWEDGAYFHYVMGNTALMGMTAALAELEGESEGAS